MYEDIPSEDVQDFLTVQDKCLTAEEEQRLEDQNKRIVPEFKARQLEEQAQRNWDLFYKRNETRFFKDRQWTKREFQELIIDPTETSNKKDRRLLEIGCGVGNLIYPLLKDVQTSTQTFFYACDLSPRAVQLLREHELYNEERIHAFQCDITTENVFKDIPAESLDICTLVFVLSAIHPDKFAQVVQNLWKLLQRGGIVLFRDYGRYDMAQLRFKAGNKISESLYVRQDGTRSYFFCLDELLRLFTAAGFETLSSSYVHRRTLNVKEGIDVPRIFLQAKFQKPLNYNL